MTRKRGGYRGDRVFTIKCRVDAGLNADLRRLAEESESSLAFVVRELVQKALSHGLLESGACHPVGSFRVPKENGSATVQTGCLNG